LFLSLQIQLRQFFVILSTGQGSWLHSVVFFGRWRGRGLSHNFLFFLLVIALQSWGIIVGYAIPKYDDFDIGE